MDLILTITGTAIGAFLGYAIGHKIFGTSKDDVRKMIEKAILDSEIITRHAFLSETEKVKLLFNLLLDHLELEVKEVESHKEIVKKK